MPGPFLDPQWNLMAYFGLLALFFLAMMVNAMRD